MLVCGTKPNCCFGGNGKWVSVGMSRGDYIEKGSGEG